MKFNMLPNRDLSVPLLETIDDSMIALIRLLLASAALIIVLLAPAGSGSQILSLYVSLAGYVIYSAVLYLSGLRQNSEKNQWSFGLRWLHRHQHWLDIAWYSLFIALSDGTNSIFFVFYTFAVVVASFLWGFGPGLRAAIVSAVLFTVVGYLTLPFTPDFNLNRLLLRPTSLLIMGYMIATFGGHEVALRRRLSLLKDISTISNPRFGVERTLGVVTEKLRDFYHADKCVLVTGEWHQLEPQLRRAERGAPEIAMRTYSLTLPMRQKLMVLPETQVVWCRNLLTKNIWSSISRLGISRSGSAPRVLDLASGKFSSPSAHTADGDEILQQVATTLDAATFLSAPICYRSAAIGRVFIIGPKRKMNDADMEFLVQAIAHVMSALDNMLLLDRLASDAAQEERERIARDLHDSIIQPYIGLRIGLSALCAHIQKDPQRAEDDLERLIEMTNMGIVDLRNYVSDLKGASRTSSDLKSSLERFLEKFHEASTIEVHLEMAPALRLNDRLAAEVFQLVAEGLSNIRRHTNSTRAHVQLECHDDNLELCIANPAVAGQPLEFIPRSIAGRAAAMGGIAQVKHESGNTLVCVRIPL